MSGTCDGQEGPRNERLSQEEEKALWLAFRSGDEEAREALILAYRPLVFWIARHFSVPYALFPDLVQEGMIALIHSIDRFDIERHLRFSTFAYYRIRGHMSNYLKRVEAKAPTPLDDEFIESHTDDLERIEENIEWATALEEGLRSLPEKESDVIAALLLEGRRAREVATEKGIDVSHVYRLQRSALARLRAFFFPSNETNAS